MNLIKSYLSTIFLVFIALFLVSWGNTGHVSISQHIQLSFPQEMVEFNSWVGYIAEHSSDADYRKSEDPDEAPRHYIDIDNYSEFINQGFISTSLTEMIALHGESTVYDNGVLPWATLNTYDSLKACFKRKDWANAKYFAADLSHYVGDGFMPLHITRNYNGQYTNQSGIHSRYESTMLNAYISQIVFSGRECAPISNVPDYVFNYLYENYPYVDSVLQADTYAKSFSTNTSSSAYKSALWEKSKGFTQVLLNKASQALAELIYNAWVEAGKPSQFTPTISTGAPEKLMELFPNPVNNILTLQPTHENTPMKIRVFDSTGRNLYAPSAPDNGSPSTIQLNLFQTMPEGIYFIEVTTNSKIQMEKVVVRH